jgi:hypothetical protein
MAEADTDGGAVSSLAFLSPGAAPVASPLARALAGAAGIRDLSLLRKLEVRGPAVGDLGPDVDVLQLTPARALVVGEPQTTLPGFVVDVTAALAGIAVRGEQLLRRLTDLDLSALPAAGKLAGVQAFVFARDGEYRIFFAQEYGHSVVEAVRDLQAGLA